MTTAASRTRCFFASDLHGHVGRYTKLLGAITREHPAAVFLGGDLLPSFLIGRTEGEDAERDFLDDFLIPHLHRLKDTLGASYPRIFVILGNDDLRAEEESVRAADERGLWEYVHGRRVEFGPHGVYGYSYVPPTPFRLKDWERYDVSAYVDPGCTHPSEGSHSVAVSDRELKYATIKEDLERLTGDHDLSGAIFLFHSPPYETALDRAALDGKSVDYVPLDLHVGSIAIRRFIEDRRPLITLHGHVHESAGITGEWRDMIGGTHAYSAAHAGPELALVRFTPERPDEATRELL